MFLRVPLIISYFILGCIFILIDIIYMVNTCIFSKESNHELLGGGIVLVLITVIETLYYQVIIKRDQKRITNII